MIRTRTAALLAASALGVTLMSACGGSYDSKPSSAPPPTQQPATQAPDQNGPIRLAASKIDKLGTVVTDSTGMTLYRFDRDTAQPSVSNCDGTCATLWPPVEATTNQVQLSGIDKSLIGTVVRKDGTKQLTIGGWPLYRYAKDTAPGQANGQGVGKTWFAATPQGKKAAATSDSGSDSGGYGY